MGGGPLTLRILTQDGKWMLQACKGQDKVRTIWRQYFTTVLLILRSGKHVLIQLLNIN